MPYAHAASRLVDHKIMGSEAEAFWVAVRGNLERFDDVDIWWSVVSGSVASVIEDPTFLTQALELLPQEPWDKTTWQVWTSAVKAASGRKGRALFHPLRLALTGRENGPELATLLPLIGRARATERLSAPFA